MKWSAALVLALIVFHIGMGERVMQGVIALVGVFFFMRIFRLGHA